MTMKACFLLLLFPLAAGTASPTHADAPDTPRPPAPDPFAAPAPRTAAPAASARPSDEAIKAAVRAVLEEMPPDAIPAGGTVLSGGAYKEFARKFSDAEKAHCMGPNALKHQPHSKVVKTIFGDFVVGAGGLLALPFWGAAIVRGKCNWSR